MTDLALTAAATTFVTGGGRDIQYDGPLVLADRFCKPSVRRRMPHSSNPAPAWMNRLVRW